jgi:DNA-binding transcriptional LysR family regulator
MLPDETEAEVLAGKYDLCILTTRPRTNVKLTALPLYEERLLLALAKDHPLAGNEEITQAQMGEQPYLDRQHCEFRSQLIQHFMDRNIVMRPRVQSEREDWIQQLVAQGIGVCSLPERSRVVPGIVLRPVKGLDLSREVTLVAVSGSGSPREVRQIIEMARKFDWSN